MKINVQSVNDLACEFHENALVFNNLTQLLSNETSMADVHNKDLYNFSEFHKWRHRYSKKRIYIQHINSNLKHIYTN